jgi:hypothetical protein
VNSAYGVLATGPDTALGFLCTCYTVLGPRTLLSLCCLPAASSRCIMLEPDTMAPDTSLQQVTSSQAWRIPWICSAYNAHDTNFELNVHTRQGTCCLRALPCSNCTAKRHPLSWCRCYYSAAAQQMQGEMLQLLRIVRVTQH